MRRSARDLLAASGLAILLGASPSLAATLGTEASAHCASLATWADGRAHIDSATWQAPAPLQVVDSAATPASRVIPAAPAFCKALGHIDPEDGTAPAIRFEVNLPADWNGRSVQYGGGGFNGVLISATGLPPAMPFDRPSPLARGFVTYGTDSGHEARPGEPPQAFALNDEAFRNFTFASYKKVRDVAVALMAGVYGHGPEKLYFMGSSEGGREALTMAQRYPADFDGIFARVPVIAWTGLQHAGMRAGLATMGEGWLDTEQTKLVADAVAAACDAVDGIVDNPVACRTKFDPKSLLCGETPAGPCLTQAQVDAIDTLHSPYRFPFPLANGLSDYPGWGVSGEANPAHGPTGGWGAWWVGSSRPTQPPQPTNGIGWVFGAGGMQYVFARDPNLDVRKYRPEDYADRVREVSAMIDSTDPDLSAFAGHGGKLIMLEHMADYAQSPYAGIRYYEAVRKTMGEGRAEEFLRLYTAPGVDHVGSGAPANVDMLEVLMNWVEKAEAPGDLVALEQTLAPPFPAVRALPLCRWPTWPHFRGGDVKQAASFACAP